MKRSINFIAESFEYLCRGNSLIINRRLGVFAGRVKLSMRRRNVPILMLALALMGLTACENKVELGVMEGPTSDNVVGYYEIMNVTASNDKGTLALDLFEDQTGYVVFNGDNTVAMNRISYSMSSDGSSMTFSGGSILNGTYQTSKEFVSSLKLTKGSNTFDFSKKSRDLSTALTECRWRHKRSSVSDYLQFDFYNDQTGQLLDYPSYKGQKAYPFTYILDPKTRQLQITYSNGSKTTYDYVCVTGYMSILYKLLLFKKSSSSSGYTVEKYEYNGLH